MYRGPHASADDKLTRSVLNTIWRAFNYRTDERIRCECGNSTMEIDNKSYCQDCGKIEEFDDV